ncbi:MAG: FeoA domain-containing protein [Bacillota bacterium]|nr:FeoA domain-containing protein [Bacillota bacterium]
MGHRFRKGQRYRILSINKDHASVKRLTDMGITPECNLSVENVAPFGGTYIIKVRGYRVAIRKSDLEALEVQALDKGEK